MRKVGIRQFQRNFYQEIKNLPVTVTKNGTPDFYVRKVSGLHTCEWFNCETLAIGKFEVEKEGQMYLCDEHGKGFGRL